MPHTPEWAVWRQIVKNIRSTRVKKLLTLAAICLFAQVSPAQIRKVVNGASFGQVAGLAPGSILTILGDNLSPREEVATNPAALPRNMAGVTVNIGGVACILFYVSPKQVNAQIDPAVPLGTATVTVASALGTYAANITVERAGVPGIFATSGAGVRDGAVLNAITFERGPFRVSTSGQPTYLAVYATGVDVSSTPQVTVAGVPVTVIYAGPAPGWVGLQQVNIRLPDSLSGAGRVELALAANGKISNVVEIVILPRQGEGPYSNSEQTGARSRELASIAVIPDTTTALVVDENDDVVRVVDTRQRKVTRVITLPEGAEPVAIATNAGSFAVVAERERNRVAIIDLQTFRVAAEVNVGLGPSAVAVTGNTAVVVNSDSDTVSIVNLSTRLVTATVAVGRAPRAVAIDGPANRVYVANQTDGTVTVIALPAGFVTNTLTLGPNSRPAAIQLIPQLGLAVIAEPSTAVDGRVVLLNLASGAIAGEIKANPDRSGGASDLVVLGNSIYFANQSGGSVTWSPLSFAAPVPVFTIQTIRTGIGARALAVATRDNQLLVANQAAAEIVLIDLATNQIAGRINAIRSDGEGTDIDNRGDRDRSPNLPVISRITPQSVQAGVSFVLTVEGSNLNDPYDVVFVDPATLPAIRGRGNSGNHGHGPFGLRDTTIATANTTANTSGTQITVNVTLAPNSPRGDRTVRVLTPNGESSLVQSTANLFRVN